MDDKSNFHLLDQLPTENEVMQNSNSVQTPGNDNPPPIYDNNFPKEVISNNNEPNTNYIPPPIYDNSNPQELIDNNNNEGRQTSFEPPPVYSVNNIQEVAPQSENIPVQYPPPPSQNSGLISEPINIPDPLSQNPNTYSSQISTNSNDNNLYEKPIYQPPNLPTPQLVEVKQVPQEPIIEVKEPVYQLRELPVERPKINYQRRCCDDCDCDCDCDCCSRECEECCRSGEWVKWVFIICYCVILILGAIK